MHDQSLKTDKQEYLPLSFLRCCIFLLMMRDSFGHAINKYLLLLICAVPTLTFNVSNLCVFYAFLFPLYIGLPGNYITLVLFIRFGFELLKISSGLICLSLL